MRKVSASVACVALASLTASSSAAFIRGGDGGTRPVTVDYISFTIPEFLGEPGAIVTIDTRSVEAFDNDDGYDWVDLNQDGEAAFIDAYIFLFRAAGADRGGLGDLVTLNDDSDETYGDGSIHHYDSHMNVFLTPGDYVLAISNFYFEEQDARNGENPNSYGPYALVGNTYDDWVQNDHGDYRAIAYYAGEGRGSPIFDVEGTIRVIPAPAGFLAFAAGLLAAGRRRR